MTAKEQLSVSKQKIITPNKELVGVKKVIGLSLQDTLDQEVKSMGVR